MKFEEVETRIFYQVPSYTSTQHVKYPNKNIGYENP